MQDSNLHLTYFCLLMCSNDYPRILHSHMHRCSSSNPIPRIHESVWLNTSSLQSYNSFQFSSITAKLSYNFAINALTTRHEIPALLDPKNHLRAHHLPPTPILPHFSQPVSSNYTLQSSKRHDSVPPHL